MNTGTTNTLVDKELEQTKAMELLAKAKEMESKKKLVHYRLDRNTVLLITEKRKMVIERNKRLASVTE